MEKSVDRVISFNRLRDVWNAKYRASFRSLAKVLGYSNDYVSSLGGVIGLCGENPAFIFLVNDGRHCKFGTAVPLVFKNGKRYCRFVFFEKSRNTGAGYDKDIVRKLKSFLKENGFHGVCVPDKNSLAYAARLMETGFRRIIVENLC